MAIIDLLTQLAPWEMINTLFIPFILIFTILWGILTAMGIFNKRLNAVLAFGIVLFLASTNLFPMVSQWMIQLGSLTAVTAFLLLFVGGVIIWGIGRGKAMYYRTNPKKARLKVEKRIEEMREKMRNADDKDKRAILKEIRELEDELEIIKAESED